MTCIYYSPVKG
jgi:hypothetical protein